MSRHVAYNAPDTSHHIQNPEPSSRHGANRQTQTTSTPIKGRPEQTTHSPSHSIDVGTDRPLDDATDMALVRNTVIPGHSLSPAPEPDIHPACTSHKYMALDESAIEHIPHHHIRTLTVDTASETPAGDAHLTYTDESVLEVVDETCQEAMPASPAMGPTPTEFAPMLDSYWPQLSGEKWQQYPGYTRAYEEARSTALPNYLASRVPLTSGLNITNWRRQMEGRKDHLLADHLQFGFPSNYTAASPPSPTYNNHKSSASDDQQIRQYIDSETQHGAILGPFEVPPFSPWTQCSPIMTRDKRGTDAKRIIVDLSYPPGRGVNAGIPRRQYLGEHHTYVLPSPTIAGDFIRNNGDNVYMWSADMARAYRQLRADPLSVPLYCVTMDDKFYVDISLPFGCRTSSLACVRVTQAMCDMMHSRGYNAEVYIDDFIGYESSYKKAVEAYKCFLQLADELGVALSASKCNPPAQNLVWLGIEINAEQKWLRIPEPKLEEVLRECQTWLKKPTTAKHPLQQLVGKLSYLASCITPARKFMRRILDTLRQSNYSRTVDVDREMLKDVAWFQNCASHSNGIQLIPSPNRSTWVIECDSCLTGGGAFSHTRYFSERYSRKHRETYPTIHELEATNLVAATRFLLPRDPSGILVVINTDNEASSEVLTTGRGADQTLGKCARELWLMSALGNYEVLVKHKPGSELILADALSRAHKDPVIHERAQLLCAKNNLCRIRITHDESMFTTDL